MSLKDVKPGTYKAKAVQGAFAQVGQKKSPAVGVEFEFDRGEGHMEHIWWVGYMTEKTLERTMNTLIGTLGFNEERSLLTRTGKDGSQENYFDRSFLADKEVELVLDEEPGQNDPSKKYMRVQWVNEVGSGGGRFTGQPVAQVLGNINLRAEAAAARARLGLKKTPSTAVSPVDDDLPF